MKEVTFSDIIDGHHITQNFTFSDGFVEAYSSVNLDAMALALATAAGPIIARALAGSP